MRRVEVFELIRDDHYYDFGLSIRAIARKRGVGRPTVRHANASAVPQGARWARPQSSGSYPPGVHGFALSVTRWFGASRRTTTSSRHSAQFPPAPSQSAGTATRCGSMPTTWCGGSALRPRRRLPLRNRRSPRSGRWSSATSGFPRASSLRRRIRCRRTQRLRSVPPGVCSVRVTVKPRGGSHACVSPSFNPPGCTPRMPRFYGYPNQAVTGLPCPGAAPARCA